MIVTIIVIALVALGIGAVCSGAIVHALTSTKATVQVEVGRLEALFATAVQQVHNRIDALEGHVAVIPLVRKAEAAPPDATHDPAAPEATPTPAVAATVEAEPIVETAAQAVAEPEVAAVVEQPAQPQPITCATCGQVVQPAAQ